MKSDCFSEELRFISDKKLKDFIAAYINESVPDYFFIVPASSSGKYHPQYALGVGGLVRHTKAAVKIAEDLLSLEQNEVLSECYHDEIISALIVHDTFKQGLKAQGGHTRFEHPVYSASALQLLADKFYPDLSDRVSRISSMVLSHMGQWNRSSKSVVTLPKPVTDAEKFVHMCDYLASRQYLTVENIVYEPSIQEETQ